MFDNIAAISTGQINQPISIIRVCGPDAFDIVKKIFSGKVGEHMTITYGSIMEDEKMVDEVLVSWFKGPNTFTGIDTVEINAHGGTVNSHKILRMILSNGARLAENGEFSKLAFLNGKMDLIKAEAIHDLIFAKTEKQAELSVKKFDGITSSLINNLRDQLVNVIATCETNIDYPEYDDVEVLTNENLMPRLEEMKYKLEEIEASSAMSKKIFEGIKVSIIGKPNAGKSSLLNALIGREKAIVTDIPGTTRDVIDGAIQIGDYLYNFHDTAGIWEGSSDDVEKIGIEKALEIAKQSDIIIHLIDNSDDENFLSVLGLDQLENVLKVYNKMDKNGVHEGAINISAKENNIEDLVAALQNYVSGINLNSDMLLQNTRQLSLITSAKQKIATSIISLENGMTPDVVIVDIQSAWEDLSNILGQASHGDILDEMFKNFCLGK